MSPELDCPHTALIRKMERDMYDGDARKAGLTIRVESVEGRMDRSEKQQASIDTKFWAIILLLLTALGGIATEMAKH